MAHVQGLVAWGCTSVLVPHFTPRVCLVKRLSGTGELDATLLSWPHSLPNLCMYASSSDSVPCPESHFASSLVCALMSALAMAVSTLVRGRDRVQAEFLPSKCVHSHWDSILHLSEKAL